MNFIDDMVYFNEIIENTSIKEKYNDITFKKCKFNIVDFTSSDLTNVYFAECEFIDCDFSNSIFSKFIIKKNKFKTCKFVGTNMIESHIEDVTFENSNLSYCNFSNSTLKRVNFNGCILKETIFAYLKKHEKLKYNKCEMLATEFFKTSMKDLDFRTCNISSLRVDIEDLKGLTVTSLQALELSNLLEINVNDEEII